MSVAHLDSIECVKSILCLLFFYIFFINKNQFHLFRYRILDSMKVPGQRSSFHICDILDLNTSASDNKNSVHNNNNNNNHNVSSNNIIPTDTSFPSQTSNAPSNRDDTHILSSTISSLPTTHPPPPPPPPPYHQIASGLSSAMYSELGHHYQSLLPTVTRSWLKDSENYGM